MSHLLHFRYDHLSNRKSFSRAGSIINQSINPSCMLESTKNYKTNTKLIKQSTSRQLNGVVFFFFSRKRVIVYFFHFPLMIFQRIASQVISLHISEGFWLALSWRHKSIEFGLDIRHEWRSEVGIIAFQSKVRDLRIKTNKYPISQTLHTFPKLYLRAEVYTSVTLTRPTANRQQPLTKHDIIPDG